ncbi:hypothetical protein [Streptomyces triticagri]|uniref:hypothetical protein n=1 Tax=Streptomyces triticagri TaxID=2293568 RepID=UPI000FFB9CF4|nr:hypothetical protein [Streptomyces triticagri]
MIVLGLAGYGTFPYAKDWWLSREVCGGALPDDAVDALSPDSGEHHLAESDEKRVGALGSYRCELSYDRGEDAPPASVFSVTADTRRDPQDASLWGTFEDEGWSAVSPLPDGMPGFIDDSGAVQLMAKCPELGKDDDGRPRRILVRTAAGWDADRKAPDALVGVAVAAANRASEQLGCGAKPFKKTGKVRSTDPEPVALEPSKAAGTVCAAFAEADLPAGTKLRPRSNSSAPVARCELVKGGDRAPKAVFGAWYGDWSKRLIHEDTHGHPRRPDTATARCDGETAVFDGWAEDDFGLTDRQVRALIADFSSAETTHRKCTSLTRPTPPAVKSSPSGV